MRTAKNPSGAVRPWDLERVSNDDIPSTKRFKPSMFETMLRECHASSRYLFKCMELKTRRGGTATCYDIKIIDVERYIAISGNPSTFSSWEFIEYDWDPCAGVFLENIAVRPPRFLPCQEELRLTAGGEIPCTQSLLSVTMWARSNLKYPPESYRKPIRYTPSSTSIRKQARESHHHGPLFTR